jgi:hypothetical protein
MAKREEDLASVLAESLNKQTKDGKIALDVTFRPELLLP